MMVNISAIGRPFRRLPVAAPAEVGGQTHTAAAPSSGIKIIAVIKPTMRTEEGVPTFQQPRRRGKFESVQSVRWTTDGPNRERQLWFCPRRRYTALVHIGCKNSKELADCAEATHQDR